MDPKEFLRNCQVWWKFWWTYSKKKKGFVTNTFNLSQPAWPLDIDSPHRSAHKTILKRFSTSEEKKMDILFIIWTFIRENWDIVPLTLFTLSSLGQNAINVWKWKKVNELGRKTNFGDSNIEEESDIFIWWKCSFFSADFSVLQNMKFQH